jgi:hypothetical protein
MTGYSPERPRTILKPIGNWTRFRDLTGDQVWANPRSRTSLWALLTILLWFALTRLAMADFGFTRTLLLSAILFPAVMFAGMVPPRGHPVLRGFLIGFGASVLLALLLVVMGLLSSGTIRDRALSALWG